MSGLVVVKPPISITGVQRANIKVYAAGLDNIAFSISTFDTIRLGLKGRTALKEAKAKTCLYRFYDWTKELLLGPGLNGYDVSASKGGITAYLSSQHENMGIHINVSSAVCMMGMEHARKAVDTFLRSYLGLEPLHLDLRLTRLDLFADLGCEMLEPEVFKWRAGRVRTLGQSHWLPGFEFEELTGQYIGSKDSAIRCRIYDKLLKYDAADLSAWGCSEYDLPECVTRFEWQIRLKDADLDMDLFNLENSLGALIQYLYEWCRLVVPPENRKDKDRRRWDVLPEYERALQALLSIFNIVAPLVRSGEGVGMVLINQLEAWKAYIAGVAARLTEVGQEANHLTVDDALMVLEQLLKRDPEWLERYRSRFATFQVGYPSW